MPEPSANMMLYPSFVMFALFAFVLVRMARLRFGAVRGGNVDPRFYTTYDEGAEPEALRVVTRHFLNLFEVPVLFHVVVILTYVTRHVSWWMVAWAWVYVALRLAHSREHLGRNDVLMRFRLYLASCLALVVIWVSLLACLLAEG